MPSKYDTYASPLAERNASAEMLRLWSPRHKFNTWRRIWLAAAEAMHDVTGGQPGGAQPGGKQPDRQGGPSPISGTPESPPSRSGCMHAAGALVTREQVEELRAVVERKNPDGAGGITDEEIRRAEEYEGEVRHDVMAHVRSLGDACPKARGIIHLGMTSEDVVGNADRLIIAHALDLIITKTARAIVDLCSFAERWRSVPALGYTHFQPAQPLTIGRRAAQWGYDLWLCWRRLDAMLETGNFWLKGFKGATGTQAAFLQLAGGDTERARALEARALARVEQRMPLTGYLVGVGHDLACQTYPRVEDCLVLADLAATAAVLHKIATDIRLLCNRKELDEPFEEKQIGSSAMPYKRNPMRCERICGLSRFVMNLVGNAYDTAATQWLERTLDDSSNRRLSLPEAFLALDGALDLMHNVASGLVVHEAMVRKNLVAELPFLATENILMECVRLGGDRQHYHELIRQHAQAAGWRVKHEGLENDLIERIRDDRNFWSAARGGPLTGELDLSEAGLMDAMKYIGRSVEQTERFISDVVEPLREQYGDAIAKLGESGPRV